MNFKQPWQKCKKYPRTSLRLQEFFFAHEEFNRSGLRTLVDNQLGICSSTKGYSHGNLFCNFFNLFLSGGECAEDIQQHFRPTLEQIPGNDQTLERAYLPNYSIKK